MNETEFVLQSFEKHFSKYKGVPIALYGLGENTGMVLRHFTDYQFVGLMDDACIGEERFGYSVISNEQAKALGVKVIIIIARSANIPIIYRRIDTFCDVNNIKVFSINGELQQINNKEWQGLPKIYDTIKESLLLEKINAAEVISFDVFDTLIMRKVLFPRDVFIKLEQVLIQEFGKEYVGFAKKRIMMEQELYATIQPTLFDIYKQLANHYQWQDNQIDSFMQKELDLEKSVIVSREKMLEIFSYAKALNKQVCLTSDMYLSSKMIAALLQQVGYDLTNVELFVSNEYGHSKANGLFVEVQKACSGKRILHIGDNQEADGLASKKYGIQDTFLIKSAYEMLTDASVHELLAHTQQLVDRDYIAQLIAKQLNNPFIFEKTSGKIVLHSEYELCKELVAPITAVFVKWLIEKGREEQIEKMLFASRDGYLLNELFKAIEKNNLPLSLPDYQYFYASRRICLLASLANNEDILEVANLSFQGSVEELLLKRFALNKEQLLTKRTNESTQEYILRHSQAILAKANEARKNYLAYIQQNVQLSSEQAKVGYFDFVSMGTCQNALQKFLAWEFVGFYFSRIYDKSKAALHIEALCPQKSIYESDLSINDRYFFLEMIFTSFEPTLDDFDVLGRPEFHQESRTSKELASLSAFHQGIIEGSLEILAKENTPTLELADKMIKFIDEKYSIFEFDFFNENTVIDEYCNRSFSLVR